jgi:hypothetical protein
LTPRTLVTPFLYATILLNITHKGHVDFFVCTGFTGSSKLLSKLACAGRKKYVHHKRNEPVAVLTIVVSEGQWEKIVRLGLPSSPWLSCTAWCSRPTSTRNDLAWEQAVASVPSTLGLF